MIEEFVKSMKYLIEHDKDYDKGHQTFFSPSFSLGDWEIIPYYVRATYEYDEDDLDYDIRKGDVIVTETIQFQGRRSDGRVYMSGFQLNYLPEMIETGEVDLLYEITKENIMRELSGLEIE